MDILKIVLYIIFVIDCIVLSAIILLQEGSLQVLEQSAVRRTHTGDRTRGVPWRELL